MNIKHYILFLLAKCVAAYSKAVGDNMRLRTANFLADFMFKFGKSRMKVTFDNLNKSFPEKSKKEISEIAHKSYRNFSLTFLEMFALKGMSDAELARRIRFENPSQIIEQYQKGRGIILLSAHYGNWEMMALAGKLWLGFNNLIPVKRLKNYYVDDMVNEIRVCNGNRVVNMDRAAFTIIKTLKQGGALALLADQAAHEGKDIYVKFFGRPALTYEAPAELALKYNVPFFECFCERQTDGTYIIRQNYIDTSDLVYSKENVRILTQRHVKILEDQIKKIPEQWAWMHKRWKHSEKCKENL